LTIGVPARLSVERAVERRFAGARIGETGLDTVVSERRDDGVRAVHERLPDLRLKSGDLGVDQGARTRDSRTQRL